MTRTNTETSPLRAGLLGVFVCALSGCSDFSSADAERPVLTSNESAFLRRHWQPIAPQGEAPESFSPLEAALDPKSCGTCHIEQFNDWQTSLHAHAMGPGVLGQLVDMPGQEWSCQKCHAPLAEQLPQTVNDGRRVTNPGYDEALQRQGLVCAACHVRQHQRFGPPPRPESIAATNTTTVLPHGGFTAESAFSKSGFCRGCHQFEPGGFALNGKLIENTYEEWRTSGYPEQNMHCQDCHMPDRRHLWRGIHDKNMVEQGVNVTVSLPRGRYGEGSVVRATIEVENTGVGHHFPTYVTPKVYISGVLLGRDGLPRANTRQQAVIGRGVSLNLAQEYYDTRIPAGQSHPVVYEQRVPEPGMQLKIAVEVQPDHFYVQFFEATLRGQLSAAGREQLEQALQSAYASAFVLYEQTLTLEDAS